MGPRVENKKKHTYTEEALAGDEVKGNHRRRAARLIISSTFLRRLKRLTTKHVLKRWRVRQRVGRSRLRSRASSIHRTYLLYIVVSLGADCSCWCSSCLLHRWTHGCRLRLLALRIAVLLVVEVLLVFLPLVKMSSSRSWSWSAGRRQLKGKAVGGEDYVRRRWRINIISCSRCTVVKESKGSGADEERK